MNRLRHPKIIALPVHFEGHRELDNQNVTAVFYLDDKSTFGLKFTTPEQLLDFMNHLVDRAAFVWPDHPIIKEYLSD